MPHESESDDSAPAASASCWRQSFCLCPPFAADLLQVYREACPTTLSTRRRVRPQKPGARSCRRRLPVCCRRLLRPATPSANDTSFDTQINLGISTSTRNRYNSNAYGVNLTQPLFRWQNFAQYDQSKLLVMQTEANFAQAGRI
jgi:outer membrane protein